MSLFSLWPAHWGLRGQMRERARVEYDFSAPEDTRTRKEKLIEINYVDGDPIGEKVKLDLLLEYGDITELEHQKQTATLNNEPWVHGELHGDPDEGFYFEMDWNALFLEYLTSIGFSGKDDEDIVDQWVTRLYANEFMMGEWEEAKIESDAGITVNKVRTADGKTEHK